LKKILTILAFVCSIHVALSQDSATRLEHFNLKKTVAIGGYDPLSYFSDQPAKGDETLQVNYKGVTYYFITEKNKKSFLNTPNKYIPAYGGWCAYAMGLEKESKVVINPKTYKIIDNKLYLFYNKLGINTKEKWNKEGEIKLKKNADKNWNQTISK
jgi:YHS domain-containing protein